MTTRYPVLYFARIKIGIYLCVHERIRCKKDGTIHKTKAEAEASEEHYE